jgi:hypothetical protein
MAVNQDLLRGDSLPVVLELVSATTDGSEEVFDLTDYSVSVSLRWPRCQTVNLTSADLTIVATAGTVEGYFSATQTSTLPDAMNMYVILETTAGVKQTYPLGRVKVASCESSTEICFD